MGSPFFVSLQGELGLPGPPGMEGEKVSEAWLDQARPCQEPNEKEDSCVSVKNKPRLPGASCAVWCQLCLPELMALCLQPLLCSERADAAPGCACRAKGAPFTSSSSDAVSNLFVNLPNPKWLQSLLQPSQILLHPQNWHLWGWMFKTCSHELTMQREAAGRQKWLLGGLFVRVFS